VTGGRLEPDPRSSQAVVLGVGTFEDAACREAGMAIDTIERSATAVGDLLRRGAVWGLGPQSVTVLGTEEQGPVTRRAMSDALRAGAARCREGGALLVYFTGHGTVRTVPSLDLFLAPGDCLYEERDTYLSASDLLEACHKAFRHTDGREPSVLPVVAFFDCCHAGAAVAHLGGPGDVELIPRLRRSDMYIVGAAKSGNRADPYFRGDPDAEMTAFSTVFLEVLGRGVVGHGPEFALDDTVRIIGERSAAYGHPQIGITPNELGGMLFGTNVADHTGTVPNPGEAAHLNAAQLAARLGGVADDEVRAALLRSVGAGQGGWAKVADVLRRLQYPSGVLARCVTPENAADAVAAVHDLHEARAEQDFGGFVDLLFREGVRVPARLAVALGDHEACRTRRCQELAARIGEVATRGTPRDCFAFLGERRAAILATAGERNADARVCRELALDMRAYGEAAAAAADPPEAQARRIEDLAALLAAHSPWGGEPGDPRGLAQAEIVRGALFQTAGRTLEVAPLAELINALSRSGIPRRRDLTELCLAVATRRSGARVARLVPGLDALAVDVLTDALIGHGSARAVADAVGSGPDSGPTAVPSSRTATRPAGGAARRSSGERAWQVRVLESVVAVRGVGFAAAVYAALIAVGAVEARGTLIELLLQGDDFGRIRQLIDSLVASGLQQTAAEEVGQRVLPESAAGETTRPPELIAAYLRMIGVHALAGWADRLFELPASVRAEVYSGLSDPDSGQAQATGRQRVLLARACELSKPELRRFFIFVLGEHPAHLDAVTDAMLVAVAEKPQLKGGERLKAAETLMDRLDSLAERSQLGPLVDRVVQRIAERFETQEVIRIAAAADDERVGTIVGGRLIKAALEHPAHESGRSQAMLCRCLATPRQRRRALDRVTASLAQAYATEGSAALARELAGFLAGLGAHQVLGGDEIESSERARWFDDFFDTVIEIVTPNHLLARLALELRGSHGVMQPGGGVSAAEMLLENWLARDIRIEYEDVVRILRLFRQAGDEELCIAAVRAVSRWRDAEKAAAVIEIEGGAALAGLARYVEEATAAHASVRQGSG
jgi:hypothetical protein